MNRTVAGSLVLVTTASGEEIPMIWVSDRSDYAKNDRLLVNEP
jgi:hypothetical protein